MGIYSAYGFKEFVFRASSVLMVVVVGVYYCLAMYGALRRRPSDNILFWVTAGGLILEGRQGSLEVDLGGVKVSIWHPGPGHTRGDTIAWVEEEKVLFSGDLGRANHPLLRPPVDPPAADAVVVATNGDNTNLVVAQIAQRKYNVDRVIARVLDPRRAAWYQEQGLQTEHSYHGPRFETFYMCIRAAQSGYLRSYALLLVTGFAALGLDPGAVDLVDAVAQLDDPVGTGLVAGGGEPLPARHRSDGGCAGSAHAPHPASGQGRNARCTDGSRRLAGNSEPAACPRIARREVLLAMPQAAPRADRSLSVL